MNEEAEGLDVLRSIDRRLFQIQVRLFWFAVAWLITVVLAVIAAASG